MRLEPVDKPVISNVLISVGYHPKTKESKSARQPAEKEYDELIVEKLAEDQVVAPLSSAE